LFPPGIEAKRNITIYISNSDSSDCPHKVQTVQKLIFIIVVVVVAMVVVIVVFKLVRLQELCGSPTLSCWKLFWKLVPNNY
jgi:hypothetical protein